MVDMVGKLNRSSLLLLALLAGGISHGQTLPPVPIFTVWQIEYTDGLTSFINWDTNFESAGTTAFPFRGWRRSTSGGDHYPVLMTRADSYSVEFTYDLLLSPPITYTLNHQGALQHIGPEIGATGTGLFLAVESVHQPSDPKLNPGVYAWDTTVTAVVTQPATSVHTNTDIEVNNVYVTWAVPFATTQARDLSPTRKRIRWVTQGIGTFLPSTEKSIADIIHNKLTIPGSAPFEGGAKPHDEGATWKLLDGNVGGQCDEQSNLMACAMNLHGIAADTHLMRASTD